MKVLFFHPNFQDYLADGLFHGLRTLLGNNCVDIPRYDSLYTPLSDNFRKKLRGNGFSMYGLLRDNEELVSKRFFWQKDFESYDLVVISNIWHLWPLFWEYKHAFKKKKVAILDGSDIPAFFPYNSFAAQLKKHPWSFLTPIGGSLYFKRELFDYKHSYSLNKIFGKNFNFKRSLAEKIHPISFSIPEEKITFVTPTDKIKLFVNHIVDEEVSKNVEGSFYSNTGSDKTVFTREEEYYKDIQVSKFGITTKRAGWDCLRHYELAANGAVLCFRDLDKKPAQSAPHDLNYSNCITYHSAEELLQIIETMKPEQYENYLTESYKWIQSKTTKNIADQFLKQCFK